MPPPSCMLPGCVVVQMARHSKDASPSCLLCWAVIRFCPLVGLFFLAFQSEAGSDYCPTNCSNLQNVEFPFGARAGCGLRNFQLTCPGADNVAEWWPFDSTTPLFFVENIQDRGASGRYSEVVVMEQHMSTCRAVTQISIEDVNWAYPDGTYPDRTAYLFFGCAGSIPESSVEYCRQFFDHCTSEPFSSKSAAIAQCFATTDPHANISLLFQAYRCIAYTAVYNITANSNLSTAPPLGIQLRWDELADNMTETWRRCEQSNGTCGYDTADGSFRCFCAENRVSRTHCHAGGGGCSGHFCKPGVKAGLTIGLLVFVMFGATLFWFCSRKRKRTRKNVAQNISGDSNKELVQFLANEFGPLTAKLFTQEELSAATKSFSESRMLGDGGFGAVYEGSLYDGRKVAVKRLYHENTRRLEQFFNEISILSGLYHPNLVKLYGFCLGERNDLLLVYEYVSNGTLAESLHGDGGRVLSWKTRLNIALETAQALSYLHCCVNPPIFHRDVKSTNILLDENFHAKVADFGLSRFVPINATHVSTVPQGTPGYVDPDYHQCYQLTAKSDVFSFGVVLMELISAKLPVDISRNRGEINLATLAVSKIQSGALDELVDPKLEIHRYSEVREMTTMVAELGLRCLSLEKDDRPTMKEVVEELENIKQRGFGEHNGLSEPDAVTSLGDTGKNRLAKSTIPYSPTSVQIIWSSSTTSPDASAVLIGSK